jgi:RHS repeat-associated protein
MEVIGRYPTFQVMSEHVATGRSSPEAPAFPDALLDPLPTLPSTEKMRARQIMQGLPIPVLGAVLVFSVPAAGQEDPPCIQCPVEEPNLPPEVSVTPGTGTFAERLITLTVYWSDERHLNASSRRIRLNGGADLAPLFSYEVTSESPELFPREARSVGSVRLEPGTNTVAATICDSDQECTTRTVTLVYAAPPPPPPAQIFAVSVTPELRAVTVTANSTSTHTFTVANDGDGPAVYLPDVVCSGPFSACSRSPDSLYLATGQSGTVTVSITSATGTNVISARVGAQSQAHPTVRAEGILEAEILIGGQRAPIVTTANVNPGTTLDRSGCLRANVGGGAAYECGDVRIVHGLPVTRTMNQARGPVLTYNSQHADPLPTFHANVRVRAGSVVPQSVHARLYINDAVVVEGEWPGTNWTAGATRRLTLLWDARARPTGVYTYRLEVWNRFPTQDLAAVAQSGELTVVNRRTSAFGPGWWIAGLEQLHLGQSGGRILWVGGDGSARVFAPVDNVIYVAANHATADTIRKVANIAGVGFERRLRDGTRVRFDFDGKHHSTLNRLGHQTGFHWTSGRLSAIGLPVPVGVAAIGYHFDYDGNGVLNRVTAPPLETRTRETRLMRDPSTRDLTIIDPDSQSVRYTHYNGFWFISSQTDRRQTRTEYHWNHYRLARTWRYMHGGATPGPDDIVTYFTPVEFLGLPGTAAVDTADAYTLINGPRFDVAQQTFIWVDRWGAPRRIRDALGNRTHIFREYGPYPALVTRVVAPNGYTRTATYDTRARLTRTVGVNSLGDGRNDTTSYVYAAGDCAYFVARITAPEKNETRIGYDSACRRIWEQAGPSAARRVHFGYNGSNQLETVRSEAARLRGEQPTTFLYQSPLANLSATITPLGLRTNYQSDAVGRDTLIDAPVNGLVRLVTVARYDVMDRDTFTLSYGDASEGNLNVRKRYDNEGNLTSVARWSSVDPRGVGTVESSWTYDHAGRVLTEVSENNRLVQHRHTPGPPLWTRTARGDTIRYIHDPLDRLTHQIVPASTYAPMARIFTDPRTGVSVTHTYPHPPFANSPNGTFIVPADTVRFEYHPLTGLMTRADNRDARIHRSYHPNGLLRTDTLRIRTWAELNAGGSFDQHVYGLEYRYDLNGRRTLTRLPENIAPRSGSGHPQLYQQFGYDAVTGALALVRNPLGMEYLYTHDLEGALERIDYPGQRQERFTYDADGRRATRVVESYLYHGPGGTLTTLNNDTYQYYDNGRIRTVSHPSDLDVRRRHDFKYSRLGYLRESKATSMGSGGPLGPVRTEEFAWDALGNRLESVVTGLGGAHTVFEYNPNTSQVRFSGPPPGVGNDPQPTTSSIYDLAGNQAWFASLAMTTTADLVTEDHRTTRSYYGADDRLRGSEGYNCYVEIVTDSPDPSACMAPGVLRDETAGAFEWYRYDALGRRVLVRTRRDHTCTSSECTSSITRIVWDGDQMLFEIRGPGGAVQTWELENDQASGPQHGRVAYTHGPGIDAPLDIIRSGWSGGGAFAVVPIANWRGNYIGGTDATGAALPCQPGCIIAWPGTLYSAFFLKTASSARLNWFGSLIEGKEDANGMFYMRNRYYNPHTGTFTQEDPIGLAGGLNLYGFAGGDAVNFHDPFGLCPERLRVNGRCPGNLSITQYDRLEAGARNDMRAAAGAMFLSMLEQGEVRLVAATGNGRDAGADLRLNVVLVTEEFFVGRTDGELAFLGLHEVGHLIQWNSGMLISAIGKGVRPNRREMDRMVRAPEDSPAHGALQDDANQFACSHATAPGSYTHYCQ